jgi:hypothetical protein
MSKIVGLGGVFFKSKDINNNKIELWEPPKSKND